MTAFYVNKFVSTQTTASEMHCAAVRAGPAVWRTPDSEMPTADLGQLILETPGRM